MLTDGWVSEVDASARAAVWEYLADTPIMGAWLLRDGRLLVISETEVVSLDTQGRKVWQEAIAATVSDFRRASPLLHITVDDGSRVVIDETTGVMTSG
ncbi:MAG: hypothetical protein IT438_00405 [Phycisphaerales bacterium]|nr:hypothetical protein [Phycisphaerales bacterium]